jgi:hypothetical protein
MKEPDIRHLQSIAREPNNELPDRIRALEDLARVGNQELVPSLLELWKRPKPTPPPYKPVNWDPASAERVVDLYVILALYKSGDASLLPEIGTRVAQAGRVLRGPDDERNNAAKVIHAIGRPEVVFQLITLAAGNKPEAVANAVRTLQLLDLPTPASGGPVSAFSELAAPVSFTIHRLREEIETIAHLSNGRITLSDGVREHIAAHDFSRGEVKRQDSLAEILTRQLDILDLTYAVTPQGVVIITFREAGARWQPWWRDQANTLRL